MVHRLGHQRDAGHPAEGGVEILEDETLVNGIAPFHQLPAVEAGQELRRSASVNRGMFIVRTGSLVIMKRSGRVQGLGDAEETDQAEADRDENDEREGHRESHGAADLSQQFSDRPQCRALPSPRR